MASKIRRIYTYTNQQGKEQTILINGTSSKDTDKKFQAFLAGVAAIPQAETPTLTQFINDTFRPGFMEGLCETTIANYERYIRLYIGPFMGQMKMREITVATIQTFYNWLAADSAAGQKRELNRCTIERISGLTSRIFKVALEMGIVEDTPFKKTILRIRAHRGGHHKALPDAEVSRIKREIPALRDERQRLYMALLVYTGMRREEVLGLGWENIHLEEGYGEVKRVVVYPNNGRAVVREGAKTEASERTFLIPDALREILLPHRREHGYLIHGETEDGPASYSTLQRTYYAAFKALGIYRKFNNHDWRATFGTQLKEQGMSSALVADLLGHSDTRMVETVYARRRQEGILKHRQEVESLNAFR